MNTTSAPPEAASVDRQPRLARPGGRPMATSWRLRARWAEACCALALVIMAVNLLAILPQKTITVDEFVHIPAGYAGISGGDFRPNNEHPPLAKLWAALPLLALGAHSPPDLPAQSSAQRTMNTARYFWEENAADFAVITFWTRVPMIALTLVLGALIFIVTRRAFGPRAGALAILLFSLEPTVLAHGRIVHTDIAAALAYLATWIALYAYLGRPTAPRAALLGLLVGAACATKYSLVILGPVVALALLALLAVAPRRGLTRRAAIAHAALVALVALVALNAAYGFRHQPLEASGLAAIRDERPVQADAIIATYDALAPAIPPYYLHGVYTVFGHNASGHQAALLGEYGLDGWWYYFPVAFALKTTLPFLLITTGALAWAVWRIATRRDRRLVALAFPLALYGALAMSSRLNIGIRHLLPAYPFLFILAAAALDHLVTFAAGASAAIIARIPTHARLRHGSRRATTRPRTLSRFVALAPRLLLAAFLAWMVVEAARAHPDYLVYVNQLARGPAWRYLSDSNVEWGDDTQALAAYLHAQGETAIRAALAGSRDTLGLFDIEYRDYFDAQPSDTPTRYVAIGASFLNGSTVPMVREEWRPDYFATFRYRQPVAVFGRAIYLYASPVAELPLVAPLPPGAYRATLDVTRPPTTLRPGRRATVLVQVRNDSDLAWPPSDLGEPRHQIRLGSRWFDASGATLVRDDARAPLYHALYPGERTDLRLTITAPPQPGDYLLVIDLAQEGIAWFGGEWTTPIRVPVRVR